MHVLSSKIKTSTNNLHAKWIGDVHKMYYSAIRHHILEWICKDFIRILTTYLLYYCYSNIIINNIFIHFLHLTNNVLIMLYNIRGPLAIHKDRYSIRRYSIRWTLLWVLWTAILVTYDPALHGNIHLINIEPHK